VRCVTGAAVFGDRCVLPQVWAALFIVTAIALIIQRGLLQRIIRAAAMGVVTIGAGSLPLQYGVTRWQSQFSLLAGVAGKAGVQFTAALHHGIALAVAVVTAGAGHLLLLVHTTHPEHLVLFMAPQTNAIGLVRGLSPARTETLRGSVVGWIVHVCFAAAMAADTGCGAATIKLAMGRLENGVYRRITTDRVTTQATRLSLNTAQAQQ
jgi:hypothetical protein